MAVAGRVLMIPAGEWASGNDYKFLDVTVHAGSSYVAKKNINNSTVAPPNDKEGWQIIAQGYDVSQLVTKNMIVDQIVNDSTKISSAASLYGVNQKVDKVNSDFASIETTLSERGKILGYLAQIPDTDTVQKVYDLTPYSGVYIMLNFNGFTNSDYIPLTGLVTGTRVISVRPEEAYYCNAKYTFVKPSGSFQGTFRFVGTTKHNASVTATLTIYGVK